jgi:BatD DUF11 like domain
VSKFSHIKLLFISAFLLTGFLLSAQKRSAKLSATTAGVNERVTLTIEAEGDQITSYFSMPTSPGVMVVGDYSSQSNVNGKLRITQQYTLLTLMPGTWTVGPFTATGRNGTVRIQPVTLVVTGQAPSSNVSATTAFLQCDIPRRTYFEGEQIIADVRVYVPEDADVDRGSMPLSSPSYVGFWHERGPDGYAFKDTVIVKNGKRYIGKTILREFLFATRTGVLTIPAFNYKCGIIPAQADAYGFVNIQPVKLISEPIQLQIKPFPPNPPINFSRIAGSFSLRASLDKQNVKMNDAVTLTVTVAGEGNLRTLQLPQPVLPDSIDILPGRTSDSTTISAFGVLGYKTYSWTLIPKQAGKFILDSVSFSYFSPEVNQYITLTTPAFELQVDPAPVQTTTILDNMPGNTENTGETSALTSLYVLLLLTPVGILGLLWWLRMRKRRKPETENQSESQQELPHVKPALQSYTLSGIAHQLNTLPPEEFIKLLYTVYHETLCKIVNINPAGASMSMLRYSFAGKNIPDEQITACIRLLEELALLRFSAPQQEQCKFWYEECRKNLKNIGYND